MILITKGNIYINIDNVNYWFVDKAFDFKTITFEFNSGNLYVDFENKELAEKAFNNIRQGLLKNLLFVKL